MKYSYKVDDNFDSGYAVGLMHSRDSHNTGGGEPGYGSTFLGFIFLFLLLPALILWVINDWFFNLWKTLLIPNILFLLLITWFLANFRYLKVYSPEHHDKLRSLYKKITIINIVIGYSVCTVILPLDFILDYAKVQLDNRSEGFFNDLFHGSIFLFLYYLTNIIQAATAPIVQMGIIKFVGSKLKSGSIQNLLNRLHNSSKFRN